MDQSLIENLRRRTQLIGGGEPNYSPQSVMYIMSRDQRTQDNHALLAAQVHANKLKVPLVVTFLLLPKSGWRAREQYDFMLEGLREVAHSLESYNISFLLKLVNHSSLSVAEELLEVYKPAAVYVDFNPLSGPRRFVEELAATNKLKVYRVDAHNIIPVWHLSQKQEVGAYTIRPKIHKVIGEWLQEPGTITNHQYGKAEIQIPSTNELELHMSKLSRNGTTVTWQSGERAALDALNDFIANRLARYALERNDATVDAQSNLSPYLHFGQISSLRIALRLMHELEVRGQEPWLLHSPKLPQPEGKDTFTAGVDALLEEMIVRKELSDNFCFYNDTYMSLEGAPNWALLSLDEHRGDVREHTYTYDEFARGQTHDELWNAAQRQLCKTGKIHGYMRMYWAKKVLEWTESPEQAIDYLVRMNDFYSIDGGDPNGYVGILWSVSGLHDRPWFDRPVYGKIRYMNQTGAAKRFNIDTYSSNPSV